MSQPDQPEHPAGASAYENILNRTLMSRTGKPLARKSNSAPLPPAGPALDHDQAANQIFDKILQSQREFKGSVSASSTSSAKEQAYGELLDDLFWDDPPTSAETARQQQTLAENNPLSPADSYQHMLHKTIERHGMAGQGRPRGALRLEASSGASSKSPSLSQEYSAALDEILGLQTAEEAFHPPSPKAPVKEDALTRTLYHQHLDDILWPSQLAPEQKTDQQETAPVNEEKIRSVVAAYLQELIQPEPYALIAIQRQILDEKYALFWIRHTLQALSQALQELETEFSIWVFMNHLELIKPLIDQEFVERHRLIIEHMLPQKKTNKLFIRTLQNQEQKLVFDRMVNNKFEDVRRILRNYQRQFSREDSTHLFYFFRSKLPEFLLHYRGELMQVLQGGSEQAVANPFLGSFLASLFFSEAFTQHFGKLQADPKAYDKAFQGFLRDKAEEVGSANDRLLPLTVVAMDLFHEKAAFFRRPEREQLAEALDIIEKQLKYVTEPAVEKETLLQQITDLIDERVQSQFRVETQALQALAQEISSLATQSDGAARTRIHHLNAIYERHYQELSDSYHKRRDTLVKLQTEEKPGGKPPARKTFILRKLKSCRQYLQRTVKLARKPLSIQYREYTPEYLAQKQQELSAQQSWDNAYEEKVLDNAFQKANIVLKSLNDSKSTVQFNLKLLFNGEPQQDTFLQAMQAVGQELQALEHLNTHPSLEYVQSVLAPYLVGLRFAENTEPLALSAQQRHGYITAYLGHVSHLKLMLNLQYKQVIFDFHTLFGLVHVLQILSAFQQEPHQDFEQHFRQTLMSSWDMLLGHCLMIGKGHYHFVANPLALNDYSWHPPLTGFGVAGDAEDDFGLLELGDEAEELPAFALGRRQPQKSLPGARFGYALKAEPDAPGQSETEAESEEPEKTYPQLPPAPGQRRLPPPSSGKFELYSAPARRQPLPQANGFSIEEDDFYKILSQTHAGAAPEMPPSPPAPPPAEADDDFGLLSFDADPVDPVVAAPPPVSASPPARPAARPKTTEPPTGQTADLSQRRKRWLEITPVPQEQGYQDLKDAQHESWETPAANPQAQVDDILRRNRLSPDAPVDGQTSISRSLRRRILDD